MSNTFFLNSANNTFPAEPFSINGYFPLYFTEFAARAASPYNTYHTHDLNNTVYYMPNNFGQVGIVQYHGNYTGSNTPAGILIADRNDVGTLELDTQTNEYAFYDLQQTVPTSNNTVLQELLDPGFGHFVQDDQVLEPAQSKIFIANKPIDLLDIHDSYIRYGPHNLASNNFIVDDVFCVFYIENGIAKPIPNYKTLDVMLVEDGQTYASIIVAEDADFTTFDMSLDGTTFFSTVSTPYDEFIARSMPDRSSEWDYDIRFRTGYLPIAPFVRDPGDYILPITTIGVPTVQVQYAPRVFQDQTFNEKMREKFEGQMVILDWPSLTGNWNDDEVTNFTTVQSDDLVNNLRMMVHGHWKQVTDVFVIKKYAYVNDYDISRYGAVQPDPANNTVGADGRYGESGLINIMCDNGSITIIRSMLPEGVASTNQTDTALELEPVWNAFPHILTTDGGTDPGDDGTPGLDLAEYDNYIDFESHGYDMFSKTELQPYEPPGSIKYYPENRFNDYTLQAIQQGQIDSIRDSLNDLFINTATILSLAQISYDSYNRPALDEINEMFDGNSAIFNTLVVPSGQWKLKRLKNNGDVVNVATNANFFRCLSDTGQALDELSDNDIDDILSFGWGRIWNSNFNIGDIPQVFGVPQGTPLTTVTNDAVAGLISDITNLQNTDVPGYGPLLSNNIQIPSAAVVGQNTTVTSYTVSVDIQGPTPNSNFSAHDSTNLNRRTLRNLLWRNDYIGLLIFNQIKDEFATFKAIASLIDQYRVITGELLSNATAVMSYIDQTILTATDPGQMQTAYDALLALNSVLNRQVSSGIFFIPAFLRTEAKQYERQNLIAQYNAIQLVRRKLFTDTQGKDFFYNFPGQAASALNNAQPNGFVYDNYIRS